MDVRFLATFVEVANTRHFGKAAENLYLTQSAVSARVKLLEEYFNTPLFIRHRGHIQLTPAGEKLVPYAMDMIDLLTRARDSLAEEDVHYIAIGSTINAFHWCIENALTDVSVEFPELSTRVDIVPLEPLTRQLVERSIDIAFSAEPMKSDELTSVALVTSELGIYSNAEVNEDAPYVHIEWGNKINEWLFRKDSAYRKAAFKTSSMMIALSRLATQNGKTVLPIDLVERSSELQSMKLIERFDGPNVSVYMSYHKDAADILLPPFLDYFQRLGENN